MARVPASKAPPRSAWAETPADTAVRTGAGFLPDFGTVRDAFAAYDRGDDAAAKELLGRIGLTSEFREWKLVLRGLIANAAGDVAAAEENWKRLTPGRLPAVLVAPLLNPAAHPDRADKLSGNRLAAKLRQLRSEIGRDRPLAKAFKTAESLLPDAGRDCPAAVPLIAAAFYAALPVVGEQPDLAKYRKLFGPHRDDPHFHRLEAMAFEHGQQYAQANGHWTAYELWLAGNPLGWPAELLARTRATLHERIGRNWGLEDEWWERNRDNPFARSLKKTKSTTPDESFRKAMGLAPGWASPVRSLIASLVRRGQFREALAAAAEFLAAHGDNNEVLGAAAAAAEAAGQWQTAVEYWLRSLALNPLDKKLTARAAFAVLHATRHALVAGDLAGAGQLFARHPDPDAIFALPMRCVLALAAKDPAGARHESKLTAYPNARIVGPYLLSVEAGLAKLKPAAKKRYADAYRAALVPDPTPAEVHILHAAFESYASGGVKYRGSGPHLKDIDALIPRAAASAADGDDAEKMLHGLGTRQAWKTLESAAAILVSKYPANPVYKLWLAEALHALAPRRRAEAKVRKLLDDAEPLWATHRSAQAADARERAESLSDAYPRDGDFLDYLFGKR